MRLGDPLSARGVAEPSTAGERREPSEEGHRKTAWLWPSSWVEWHLPCGLVPECDMGAGAQEKRLNHGPPS